MAKKYEFLPDKPRGGLLQRLHLTHQQQLRLLKWALYALWLVALSVLQDVILSQMHIGGATTDLVPCGIFLICILEGAEQSSIFTLVASVLYLFSGTASGPYAMVLITVLAIVVSIFRQGYLQKGFYAAMLCTAIALFLYEIAVFAVGAFLGLTTVQRFGSFLLTGVLTMVAAPVIYLVTGRICKIGGQSWKE